ncbi:large subunit ribosomal protein L31 [Nonomuraea solani]|uniref:Large ribosomal subunit protein bL31B n=1 Tax=Nonomuraea solani TaxID=1144553 RepID=A0A1H6BGR7_9ACTN|nr:type B 50S ribosomal protein L31 [Nonomuraea solani]SEG59971.1 large subunit ribosomal protein L31 [Nonomuraea solani]
MKKNLHSAYRPVVFRDPSAGFAFLTRSTLSGAATVEWEDGRTYPVIDVDVSSASHPFYTGRGRILDTAGRVERFKQRYGKM